MLKMDSQVGGCSDVYAHDANYVLIDHRDGSAGLYLHLEHASSSLRVGDPVATGEVIARVGRTGWSCGPHLHFHLADGPHPFIDQGLPVLFSHFWAGGQFFTQPTTIPTRMIVVGEEE